MAIIDVTRPGEPVDGYSSRGRNRNATSSLTG
jgi:hypothetical protein